MSTQKKQEHLTLKASNSSGTEQPFNLFGASYNGFDLDTANVTINVPQSSQGQVQADNMNTAFRIVEMKISVSNVDQLDVPIYIKTKDATGEESQVPFSPSDYTNPANEQDKLVDSGPINIPINSNVGFQGTLLPKSNMTLYVTLEYDYRPSNFINGMKNFFQTRVHKLMFPSYR